MKLRVEGLSFEYEKKEIFRELSMDVNQGEFVTIVGPSGVGKSTILNILSGTLKAEKGKTMVDGEEIQGITAHFAYMPQEDLLFPWKTILENVCLYGRIHGEEKEMKEEAIKKFPMFGLQHYEYAYPRELSGGMRQRAAFLRTIMCDGDIMLLDEPFGALDVLTRGDMQDWLVSMRKQFRKTTILVTHDIDEAIYLSDRILVLSGTPALIAKEIRINQPLRTRDWLYQQGAMRSEIYNSIKGGKEYHAL